MKYYISITTISHTPKVILSCHIPTSENHSGTRPGNISGNTNKKGKIMLSSMLTEGDNAPDFTIQTDMSDTNGGVFTLKEQTGMTVVFFFPKADTSGCTKEAIAFSELKAEFDALNVAVIGISKDTPEKQGKFRAKHALTCALGADNDSDICEQFGVWVEKSMYGRKYMGIARATFIIDTNGVIQKAWPKVKVPGHAEDVLEAMKALL
jgi:peroxiredoxin Q/BCP